MTSSDLNLQYIFKLQLRNKPIRTHKADDWNGKKFDWPIRSIESKTDSGLSPVPFQTLRNGSREKRWKVDWWAHLSVHWFRTLKRPENLFEI